MVSSGCCAPLMLSLRLKDENVVGSRVLDVAVLAGEEGKES